MRILLTGATGYIGGAVGSALAAAGHEIIGLVRSAEAARKAAARGFTELRGDLRDTDLLADAAHTADAAVHAANLNSAETPAADAAAVTAILDGLAGSGKPFIYTSGVWVLGSTGDRVADEGSPLQPTPLVTWRPAVEREVLASAQGGVCSTVIRPAIVYGLNGGMIAAMVAEARREGRVRFVGDGRNHWPLVQLEDLAELYTLALDRAPAGSLFLAAHGPSVPVRVIAEVASRAGGAGGKVESWPLAAAREVLGPYADALVLDQRVTSERARRMLGWSPRGAAFDADLAAPGGSG